MPPGVYGDRGLESFMVPMHHTGSRSRRCHLAFVRSASRSNHNSSKLPVRVWCHSVKTNISVSRQTMRQIRLSIHQHKPRTLYLGLNPRVKPLQAVSLPEFTLRLFPSPPLGNSAEVGCQEPAIGSQEPPLTRCQGPAADRRGLPLARKITL